MPWIERLGPSMTVLHLHDGSRVLFSYETPVAAYVAEGPNTRAEYWKTDRWFSRTTTGHVNRWLGTYGAMRTARTVPHDVLVKLMKGGK